MYSLMLVGIICLLIVGLMILGSKTEEGFITVDANSALAQRQMLQFEGERRYNTLARVQNPASNPSSDTVDQSINMLIPTETNSTTSRLVMTPSSGGFSAADDGTNKQGSWLEQTGKVQEKIDFCESLPANCDFSDPRTAECGFCHKGGINSKGQAWRGGMYISSDDQIRANQANKEANPDNDMFGPMAVYAPTVGKCPANNFTLIKERCTARDNALQCESAPGPSSSNSCAQCYGSSGPLLYVGAKPRSFQAILHMSHPGVYGGGIVQSGSTNIKLMPSTKVLLDPQHIPLTLSEGDNITIKLIGVPNVWCAWISSPDGKRSVSLDVGVQSINPAGLGVIGDKLSLKVSRAFAGEADFSAFNASVPNTVMWYGRNRKIPGIIVMAKYGVSVTDSVSVLGGARRLAETGQAITVGAGSLGVADPSPGNSKQLFMKMDTGANFIGNDGDTLDAQLFNSVLTISVSCPATLVDPTYDMDLAACPSGPLVFTEAGAGLMGANSCFKPDGSFNPTMYCIQEMFTGAGGTQDGTLWPNSKEKLAAIIQNVNGAPNIDATSTYLNNLGNIATYAQDQNGAAVSFDVYLDASMKMLGTVPKNLCDGPTASTGPHTPQCLDYLWKTSGSASNEPSSSYNFCGRNGLLAPLKPDGSLHEDNIANANIKGSVTAVRSYYKSIFDAAKNTSDFPKWKKSMANCYNTKVDIPPPVPEKCPLTGIANVSYIQLGYGPSYINLSQLVAFDTDGNNVTRGKPVTASTIYSWGPWTGKPEIAVDGAEQPRDWPFGIYHSNVEAGGDVLEISLGRPTTISKVVVYNRISIPERMKGHVVRLLDANKTILYNSMPLTQERIQPLNLKVSALPSWDITTSRLAGYVDIPYGNYTLKFGITVKALVGNWGSIIHITQGGDCCDFGKRSPAIWLTPNDTRVYVRIGSTTAGGDWGITTDAIPIGKRVMFDLTASGSQVNLTVNDKSYNQTQPGQRPTGKGFQIWMNDNKIPTGYAAANATIDSLVYIVDGQNIKVLQTGSVPVRGPDTYTYYQSQDHGGDDIACLTFITPEQCRERCDADSNCKAYNLWTPLSRQGCCLKRQGNITGPNPTSDFYVKKG